jgi:TatD DNase family protein
MLLTDTHCHLDLEKFNADRSAVIERALASGVTRILIPGITLKSSHAIVNLAESHPNLFAAVGVHPNEALTWDPQSISALRELAANLKVVAIGEIGLDYYWNTAPHDYQQMVLKAQLDLAAELQLPVLIHLREKEDAPEGECARDLIRILEEWGSRLRVEKNPLTERPGVLHSFSGTRQTAEKAIDLNFYIGVTGPLTFKNAEDRRRVIASVPLERLLIETDAPFLAPFPKRGERNEPAFVMYIAEKIATLHSITPDQAADVTSANAARLFAWGG